MNLNISEAKFPASLCCSLASHVALSNTIVIMTSIIKHCYTTEQKPLTLSCNNNVLPSICLASSDASGNGSEEPTTGSRVVRRIVLVVCKFITLCVPVH